MSRESMIILLGLLVIFVPVLGIPSDWKQPAMITIGVLLMILGYALRRSMYLRTIDRGNGERGTDSFVEQSAAEPTVIVEEAESDNATA